MKLLPIDFIHRNFLINKRALKLDAEGNETLAGLSCLESASYLRMFEDVTKGFLPVDIENLRFFLLMHDRHTTELDYSN